MRNKLLNASHTAAWPAPLIALVSSQAAPAQRSYQDQGNALPYARSDGRMMRDVVFMQEWIWRTLKWRRKAGSC